MAIEAIQNNNNQYQAKRMSVAGSAALGALAGYSAKWMLPITNEEKDVKYTTELKRIAQKSRRTRKAQADSISSLKAEGADTFANMKKNGTLLFSEIEKLDEPTKTNVKNLFNKMNNAARATKNKCQHSLEMMTKSARPSATFILIGMGLTAGIAFMYNLGQRINENDE